MRSLALLLVVALGCSSPVATPAPADGATEASADAVGADAAPDVVAPDVAADVGGDADLPDAALDAAPRDAAAPDAAQDAASDDGASAQDVAQDADPLLERATDMRVTVTATGYAWTEARAQSCTVTRGVVSASAEFLTPERATFTLLGPSTMTMIGGGGRGASDIAATIRTGEPYASGDIRRINVVARGMIPGGLALEVIARGCTVTSP